MLNIFRQLAQRTVIKVLFLLLILSFILWGVGDIFRGSGGNAIATVGDSTISREEYIQILRNNIERYQRMFGSSLTSEQVSAMGLRKMVLGELVNRRLYIQEILDLGLTVGDDALKARILENPAFQDDAGKFSPEVFRAVLKANGMNEADYSHSMRTEMGIGQLLRGVTARPLLPEAELAMLYRYRNEVRKADIVIIPSEPESKTPEPSETDLVQFYQENQRLFTYPETRDISYLVFSASNLKQEGQVSEQEIEQAYQAQQENYTVPEKRVAEQYLLDSKENAEATLAGLKAGNAKEYANHHIALGSVAREGLLEEVRDTVFSLKQGEYSAPVESSLGWHIFRVSAVEPSHVQPLAEVKDQLVKSLMAEKVASAVYETAGQMEDDLAAGMNLEEVAKKYEFSIQKIAGVTRDGQAGASGKDLKGDLPEPSSFLSLAFSADAGVESSLVPMADNRSYLLFRVDSVVPERVRALDEVKGRAITLWKDEYVEKQARERANTLSDRMKEGKEVAELVGGTNASLKLKQVVQHPGYHPLAKGIPEGLAKELFTLKVGEATHAYPLDMDGYVVAKLVGAETPEQVDAGAMAALKEELQDSSRNEILAQYQYYLRQKYPVVVNYEAVNAAF